MSYLRERDPFTRAVRQDIATRYLAFRREMDDELAYKIINTLGKSFKSK